MEIKKNFKDIMLVDEKGKIEYFNIDSFDFFDLIPKDMLGRKAHQFYSNLDDETSTLMRAVNLGEECLEYTQELVTSKQKIVRQKSDTLCIKNGEKIVGAIEFAYYDKNNDLIDDSKSKKKKEPYSIEKVKIYDIIGNSEELIELRRKFKKVVDLDSPILITGETGTGKEMAARAIHNSGKRSKYTFIYVNCNAIPANLLEGILFGIKKGSFTDAEEKIGLFQIANDSTLFLDEVDSMPLEVQGKILKAIEEKKIRPIGGEEEVNVNVRIIASCNVAIETLINSNQLRSDLYFRLSVIQFELPKLKNRGMDVLLIADYYIKYYNEFFDKEIKCVSEKTKEYFLRYDWPGNIRELKNTIEGVYHLAKDDIIDFEDLKVRFDEYNTEKNINDFEVEKYFTSGMNLKEYIEEFEKNEIIAAIKQIAEIYNGDSETYKTKSIKMKEVANNLGISSQLLKHKIEKYGL